MLLGRAVEEARVAALLDAASAGRSGALVVRGEAGIGKSALLEHAAAAADFQVLRARGVETESEIDFAGLHDLLAPVVGARARLPRSQADALGAALGLGPHAPVDRLPLYAGVLSLLSMASRRAPVLAVVDDAHLLDRASAEAIAFAARRLRDDRVAMLFAIREGEPSAIVTDDLPQMPLRPIDDASASELLDRRPRPVTGDGRARILALAQGNPLAILELPALGDAGLEGSALGAIPAGGLLARAFGRRIERLPRRTRTAIIVAAASDDDDLRTVLAACRTMAIPAEALAPAETANVVDIGVDTIAFRHPLVRAAAYADASPAERRAAHAAIAAALVDRATEDRWAWHRALAAVGPDESVAVALEAVAARSTSVSSRARALERAAHLTPEPPARAGRLIAAAIAAEEAGELTTAEGLAMDARALPLQADQIAARDHLLGRIWTRTGRIIGAIDVLSQGAHMIASADPDRAALMLADATEAAIEDDDRAGRLAADAQRLLRPGSPAEQLVMLRVGDVHGWRGEAAEAARAWRRAADLADADDPWSLRLAAEALFSAGLDDQAVDVARAAVDLARVRDALNALTQSLEIVGQAEARRGRLQAGIDALTEEVELVVALGQVREERYARVAAAWTEAALGHAEETRDHVARSRALETRMGWAGSHSLAIGVLELALGRPDLAVDAFEHGALDQRRLHTDAISPRSLAPAYVEALVRVDRTADARPIAMSYEALAAQSGRPLAIALATRCRGLVAGSTEDLETSAESLSELANPYEEARSRLCLGESLRRQGKRAAARTQLRRARAAFELVGAAAWADRADTELGVLGDVTHSRPSAPLADLTPQERNVTRLVASGRSNREIAERLFVTTNTVETHLRHIFQKLDVTSRTQLAIAFRDSEAGRLEADADDDPPSPTS